MRDLSFEQLFILAALLVAGLVNLMLDWFRSRGRMAQPRQPDRDVAVEEEEEHDLAETLWREGTADLPPEVNVPRAPAKPPPPVASGRGAMPSVVPRIPGSHLAPRSGQGRHLRRRIDPREARRGVVLMTILGPCRGMEPPAGNPSGRRPPQGRDE